MRILLLVAVLALGCQSFDSDKCEWIIKPALRIAISECKAATEEGSSFRKELCDRADRLYEDAVELGCVFADSSDA